MFVLYWCSGFGRSVETVTDLCGRAIKKCDACRQNFSLSHEVSKNAQIKKVLS